MLIIEYDPLFDQISIPDGRLEQEVKCIIVSYQSACEHGPQNIHWKFSNENVILAFRLYVKRKLIAHTDIAFLYQDKMIEVQENGKCFYPNGFCDVSMNFLSELF